MAVRQVKIFKKNNINSKWFHEVHINDSQLNYNKEYTNTQIKNGNIISERYIKLNENKLMVEIIYKDIESFLSGCYDFSHDDALKNLIFRATKHNLENNITETQTRDFNYNLES